MRKILLMSDKIRHTAPDQILYLWNFLKGYLDFEQVKVGYLNDDEFTFVIVIKVDDLPEIHCPLTELERCRRLILEKIYSLRHQTTHGRILEILRLLRESPRVEIRLQGDGVTEVWVPDFLIRQEVDLLRELKGIIDSNKDFTNTVSFSFRRPLLSITLP